MSLSVVLLIVILLWNLYVVVRVGSGMRRMPRLRDVDTSSGDWPSLAVVIAARDEEREIEASVRSLMVQDYPGLQIIVVNDRSTDRTGEILDTIANDATGLPTESQSNVKRPHPTPPRQAGEGVPADATGLLTESRLLIIHNESLPTGWLGKTHAMQVGADASESEWILFTDADVKFGPDALRRAVRMAEERRLDHLLILPDMIPGSPAEQALVSFFSTLFLIGTHIYSQKDLNKPYDAGVGAFNLVQRSAYERAGGHEAIRMELADDVKLGRAIVMVGGTRGAASPDGLVTVRWQESAMGVVRGLEKSAFATMRFSWPLSLITAGVIALASFPPYLLLPVHPLLAGVTIATYWLFPFASSMGRYKVTWPAVFLHPIGAFLLVLTILRSAWVITRVGGVRWRDTFYSLDDFQK
jgi:cellulose synthase/poly-beta-1,6-N-acetylglucosamine synthase-like glycosyltransferase